MSPDASDFSNCPSLIHFSHIQGLFWLKIRNPNNCFSFEAVQCNANYGSAHGSGLVSLWIWFSHIIDGRALFTKAVIYD